MSKGKRSSIQNPEQYEALRERGASKEKAARIANADRAGSKGGRRPPYEDWTRAELYEQARKVGVRGRSGMNKAELKRALRGP